MYNELGHVGPIRQWTKDTIFCYERGCICSNCPIQQILYSKCRLKPTVLALVTKFGKPEK